MRKVLRWAALLALLSGAGAQRAQIGPNVALRPTFGGVIVEASLSARGTADELLGVWAQGARAKLLSCRPKCQAAERVPVYGTLTLGRDTPYRIVLGERYPGGRYARGQRVIVVFSFKSGVRAVAATVARGP